MDLKKLSNDGKNKNMNQMIKCLDFEINFVFLEA